jgi:hypothetical protein
MTRGYRSWVQDLTLYLLMTTIVAPPRNARNTDNFSCLSFGNAEKFSLSIWLHSVSTPNEFCTQSCL